MIFQTPIEKEFFDKAPILTASGEPIQPKKFLDSADLDDLKAAIQNVAKTKLETREIQSLKKELKDYEEDLKDLVERSTHENSKKAILVYLKGKFAFSRIISKYLPKRLARSRSPKELKDCIRKLTKCSKR